MIPYFKFTEFYIGPIRIFVWGLLVAIGVVVAVLIATREAKKRGLDYKKFSDVAFWIIIWSFIGARLGHVFFYEWSFFQSHLLEIFKVWHGGLSSYGGFIGGIISGIWLLRKQRAQFWLYADCAALGLAPGWTIGRIGCFLIHDHPGTLTDFALAVKQPGGGARHDLGLYDGLLTLGIFFIFLALRKKKLFAGSHALILMGVYGFVRFFLDFLRATDLPGSDIRFFSLTPAQYFSLVMVVLAISLFVSSQRMLGSSSYENK